MSKFSRTYVKWRYLMVETFKLSCVTWYRCAVSIPGYELWITFHNFLLGFKIACTTTGRVTIAITLGPFQPSPILAPRVVYTCPLAVITWSFSCLSVIVLKCAIWVVEICCVIFTTSLKQNKPQKLYHLLKVCYLFVLKIYTSTNYTRNE